MVVLFCFLPCFVSERKGRGTFQPGHRGCITGGAAKAAVCAPGGGLHPGRPSALSRPPTRDKLSVPHSPPRTPRTPSTPHSRRGMAGAPSSRPAVQPRPSPASAPAAPSARRSTKTRVRVRGSPPGVRASTRGAARLGRCSEGVCSSAGREPPAAPAPLLRAQEFPRARPAGRPGSREVELPSPPLGQSLLPSSFKTQMAREDLFQAGLPLTRVSLGRQDPQEPAGRPSPVEHSLPRRLPRCLPGRPRCSGLPARGGGAALPARSVPLPSTFEPPVLSRWPRAPALCPIPTRGAVGAAPLHPAASNAALRPQARPLSEVTRPATSTTGSCEGNSAATAPPSRCSR